MKRFNRTHLLAITIVVSLTSQARADEVPFDPLLHYVNNDTVVIATARFNPAILAQLQGLVGPLMVTPVDREMMEKFKPILETWGDRRLFVVAGIHDMMPGAGGPLVIVTANPGETQFREFAAKLQSQLQAGVKPESAPQVRVIETKGALFSDVAALIGSKAVLARLDAMESQPRPDLIEPLTKFVENNTPISAVVAPGPDARRVIREMWPQLPAPFDAVTGPLIADRVRQVTLTAQLPPEWSAEVAINTTDDRTAQTLAATGQQAVAQFAPLLQSRVPMPSIDWSQMLETVTPKQDGAAVKLTVKHDDATIAKAIANVLSAAMGDARAAAQRNQRMHQFRDLVVAFMNFHDTQKFLPASAAICDKDGKPLLSWRVAMLPFIDETELFNEFHLDEPWDSEHNLKLLERMPEPYADPARPDHGGKTTYLLPVHSATVFPPTDESTVVRKKLSDRDLYLAQGTTFRDITDGTSHTILIVEAAPEKAVPWTRPADWEVDFANPIEGLKQEGRDGFISAFCDGHSKYIQSAVSPEILRKLLTRAGGEVINEAY